MFKPQLSEGNCELLTNVKGFATRDVYRCDFDVEQGGPNNGYLSLPE